MSRPNEHRATPAALRALMAALGISALAACTATIPSDRPFDVGNMAYPEPLPEGNVSTTVVTGPLPIDTGNMAYPEPLPQGNLSTTVVTSRLPTDTGNMAYPEPVPAGIIGRATVSRQSFGTDKAVGGPNTRTR